MAPNIVPEMSDLPRVLQEALWESLRVNNRRFYVAWHPDYPEDGVLRNKDATGLAEWESRTWTIRFGGNKPTITDVTDSIPDLWRSILRGDPVYSRFVFVPPATMTLRERDVPLAVGEIDLSRGFVDFGEFLGNPHGVGRFWTAAANIYSERFYIIAQDAYAPNFVWSGPAAKERHELRQAEKERAALEKEEVAQ